VSEYVALCRPLPGGVVTYFVTSSKTTSFQLTTVGPAEPEFGMTIVPLQVDPMP
jgi:hypothetical protein